MVYYKFKDLVDETMGELTAQDRAEIDALKAESMVEQIEFTLAELRKTRGLTQIELAQRMGSAQSTVSAMENSGDNLVSTISAVVESLGGRLELVAVFDDKKVTLKALAQT